MFQTSLKSLILSFFFQTRSPNQNPIDEALISIEKQPPCVYANRRRKASRIANVWTNQKRRKKDTVDTGGRPTDYFQGWPRRWMYLADLSASAALRLHRPKASGSRMTSAAPRCRCKRVGAVPFDSIIIIDLVIEITIWIRARARQ